MLRAFSASLLLGCGLFLAAFYLAYSPQAPNAMRAAPWSPAAGSASAAVGSIDRSGRGLQLTLDELGRGVLLLPLPSITARELAVLHLSFASQPQFSSLGIFWQTAETGEQRVQYWLPGTPPQSLWMNMGDLDAWSSELQELAFLIQGKPGERIAFARVELLPASPANLLRSFWNDWSAWVPWGHASINLQSGLRSAATSLYPVPVFAAVLVACLLAYGLWLAALRGRWRFDWRVISLLFLLCWVSIDLVWQSKLLQQLQATRASFSGKTPAEKLLSGPDRALVQLAADIKGLIGEDETRLFVASANDYSGMRASYYLLPLNVFWLRYQQELPAREHIKSGDYILTINPTRLRFDRQNPGVLTTPDGDIAVDPIASGGVGSLYRVM